MQNLEEVTRNSFSIVCDALLICDTLVVCSTPNLDL